MDSIKKLPEPAQAEAMKKLSDNGAASLEFLDETGKVTSRLPAR